MEQTETNVLPSSKKWNRLKQMFYFLPKNGTD
jgi:hypothetical protein